jgi:hypothetical protein
MVRRMQALFTNLGAAALLKKELAGIVEYEEREGSVEGRGAVDHLVTLPLGRLRQVREKINVWHRLNMELEFQSLFRLRCTAVPYSLAETPQLPPPPHLGL